MGERRMGNEGKDINEAKDYTTGSSSISSSNISRDEDDGSLDNNEIAADGICQTNLNTLA